MISSAFFHFLAKIRDYQVSVRCISRQADCLATSWMLVTGPHSLSKCNFMQQFYLENIFQLKVCPECGMCALSRTAVPLKLFIIYRCKMPSDKNMFKVCHV